MKIGILGTGHIGKTLVTRLSEAGHVPGAFCGAPGVLSKPKLDALFEWTPV